MNGLQHICFSCRHTLRIRHKGHVQRRSYSRGHFSTTQPYILPRLVIDLDADDSEFVRKLEDLEKEDEKTEDDIEVVPISREKFPKRHGRRTSLATITPPDLLTFALVGDPDKRKPTRYTVNGRRLGQLYAAHAIHPSNSIETKVQILLQNSLQNTREHEYIDASDVPSQAAIANFLSRNHELDALRQFASIICSSKRGCEGLRDNGVAFVQDMKKCVRGRHFTKLVILNNLTHNMKSKGVDIGSSLCNYGLHLASKNENMSACLFYLDIHQSNTYDVGPHARRAMSYLFAAIYRNWHGLANAKTTHPNEAEILKILMGHVMKGNNIERPKDHASSNIEEERNSTGLPEAHPRGSIDMTRLYEAKHSQRSFVALALRDTNVSLHTNMYNTYVLWLGQLGLVEQLRAELKYHPESDSSREWILVRQLVFAIAFMLARHSEEARAVLDVLPQTKLTDNHQLDAEREIGRHKASTSTMTTLGTTLRRLIFKTYANLGMRPSEELLKVMVERFSFSKLEPASVIRLLDTFLLRDAPVLGYPTRRSQRLITYVETGGVTKLLVMPWSGSKPLYGQKRTLDEEISDLDDID